MKKLILLLFIPLMSFGQTADEFLINAWGKLDSKDFKEAKQILSEALDIYPNNSRLWANQAIILEQMNDYDGAKFYYMKAVKLGSIDPVVYTRAANLHMKSGIEYAVFALQFLDRLIDIYPRDVEAYNQRAQVCLDYANYLYEDMWDANEDFNWEEIANEWNAEEYFKKAINDYDKAIEINLKKIIKDGKFVLLDSTDRSLLDNAYYNRAVAKISYAGLIIGINDSIYYSYCKDLKDAERWGNKSALELAKQLNCK